MCAPAAADDRLHSAASLTYLAPDARYHHQSVPYDGFWQPQVHGAHCQYGGNHPRHGRVCSCYGGRPEVVIVEDSNSGYEFYRALCEKSGIRCVSADFFSWERFFTKELVGLTADKYLAYRKKSLNTAYLQPKEMAALKKALPDLGL